MNEAQAHAARRRPGQGGTQIRVTREPLPDSGVLVPLSAVEMSADGRQAIEKILRSELAPMALNFQALTADEATQLSTVRLNSTMQRALTQLAEVARPNAPTFTVLSCLMATNW